MKRRGVLARGDHTNGAATEEVLRRNPGKSVSVESKATRKDQNSQPANGRREALWRTGISCHWTDADVSASPTLHRQTPTRDQLARNSEKYSFPHPKLQKGVPKVWIAAESNPQRIFFKNLLRRISFRKKKLRKRNGVSKWAS